MKYIDADKLLALIDTKIQELGLSGSTWVGRSVLHDLRSDITSLREESKDKNVFIQKAIQWMRKTVPVDDVLSVEMIEDFKKTMMED